MVLSDGLLRLDFAMASLYGRPLSAAPVFLRPYPTVTDWRR